MKQPNLICTKCRKLFPANHVFPRCDVCNEPLELQKITQGKINQGNIPNQTILDRYADFFPL